jgi:hypothetical protein
VILPVNDEGRTIIERVRAVDVLKLQPLRRHDVLVPLQQRAMNSSKAERVGQMIFAVKGGLQGG